MFEKNDEESKDGSSSCKKNRKENTESGSRTSNSMKDGNRSKRQAEAKIYAAILLKRKTNKMEKQKAKTSQLSCYRRT